MSFHLEDKNGYLGDLATHQGVRDMMALGKPALGDFLDNMHAGEGEVPEIMDEIKDQPTLSHLHEMLKRAQPPVTISDGFAESD
jgi:hypothetical protein